MSDTPHRPARHARPRRSGPYRPKYAIVDQPIKAPGFAAFSRRHPESVRQAGIAAIAGGLVVFAVASAVGASASPTARPKHAVAAPVTTPAPQFDVLPPTSAPAIVPVVAAKPKPAPVNNAVISGLAANGIPTVALNAYRVAAARLAHAQPGCGIDWALLAGIGREESDHGQFAGAVLHADGVSTPRIIGIPLNGNGTALIRDTDHGVLDGDTVYDHALGPMQFIPSTWAIYGTDANGDGKADIFNINDAALTAARYLCAAGGNLRTHAGQVAAVLAYNDSAQYLAQVLALADAYRRGVSISGLPVGNVSGTLPPVGTHGAPPPANPGAPTANAASSKPTATAPTVPGAAKAGSGSPGAAGGTAPAGPGGSASGTSAPAAPGAPGSSAPAPASTPAPSPTTTKCVLPDLLNPGKCAIPGK
ncbi:MAG TPA: lytic murein transglycosylase [Jatrophihabitantaceae bacterium]|nr:lytic murein transglycosylase [Jatrophihabitantaceae bacterium]